MPHATDPRSLPPCMQAPRRVSNLERAPRNPSASSGGAGAWAKETPRVGGARLGSEGAGLGLRGGRGSRGGRGGGGGGREGGGGGRSGSTLLPSTNMQLSNAFHVSLKGAASVPSEAAMQCCLYCTGDFGSSLCTPAPNVRLSTLRPTRMEAVFPRCHRA